MARISDALELLTAQHAQIDDLFDLVATLRDPDALTELTDTLTSHLAAEQELLYPALELAPEVRDELVAEHLEMKRVLADLIWLDADDSRYAPSLDQLRALFDGHAGYQEDELFTSIAETMTSAQLSELGTQIAGSSAPVIYEHARALAS